MNALFLRIVNMSIAASWLVVVVLLLRVVLKKAPKWVNVLLWGLLAFRLLFPFSIESVFCLIPSAEMISSEVLSAASTDIPAEITLGAEHTTTDIVDHYTQELTGTAHNGVPVMSVLSVIWLTGVACLLLYATVSYLRLRKKVRTAIPFEKQIYQSEHISTPFLLGIISPKIYIPFTIAEQNLHYVIAHEQAHIQRKDHWWKPLGFVLLAIHWFNPLMWLAYGCLCRDIELACDEKVIIKLDSAQRADYTQALLFCSVNHRIISACPLAFGEIGVKERVKSIMTYKKPAFWILMVSLVLCGVLALGFLTNPKKTVIPTNSEASVDGERVDEQNVDGENENGENVNGQNVNGQNVDEGESAVSENGEQNAVQILTNPPVMTLQDCLSSSLELYPVQSGTYSWHYAKNSDEMVAVEASGNHPTSAVKGQTWLKIPDYNDEWGAQYTAGFSVLPDRIQIQSYDLLELGNNDATVLSNEVTENCLIKLELGRIYEVTAEWDEEHLEERGFYGNAIYAFAVDSEYRTRGEAQENVTIQAHLKDVLVDTRDKICISSDSDGYPGAFIVIVPENVYDKNLLYGGQSILITMRDTGEMSGTLPVYKASYLEPLAEI